jgi:predicted small integral membrane protein
MDLSWMAWTPQTAVFFLIIFSLIITMTIWEFLVPGGAPRHGILGIETTRGDRLFISLLGAAYINILWMLLTGFSLWWALGLACVYALCVFKWV